MPNAMPSVGSKIPITDGIKSRRPPPPSIRNNLSEQIKIFQDSSKNTRTKVIKPNPLPAPVFQANTEPSAPLPNATSITNDSSHTIVTTTTSTTTTTTTTTKAIKSANDIASGPICPLCSEIFQPAGHRPIGELSCGHSLCFQCFVLNTNQTGCVQCQTIDENGENAKLEPINGMEVPTTLSDDHQANTQQLVDEINMMANTKSQSLFNANKSPNYTDALYSAFHRDFGLSKFRQNQFEAITAALQHHDCFVLMPTGGGKSLCYQLPALLDKGVTFVVAPLRSLIFDQKQRLLALGIRCAALTGNISQEESDEIYRQLYQESPPLKIVFITPEKIAMSDQLNTILRHLYNRQLLARFVIDECHCVSEWGHDFRRDYSQLGQLRLNYPDINITLLTATATPRVQTDILQQLNITGNYKLFIQSFNRSNLVYECIPKVNVEMALHRITDLIKTNYSNQSGIIYCFSRAECDRTAQYLVAHKIRALSYHAGLTDSIRQIVQTDWINDECQIICATVAFGMGIDKNNVRFVIHLSMPQSIEGYYQESGRAGRDGEISYCHLFFSYDDFIKMKRLILKDSEFKSTIQTKQVRVNNLNRVYDYCLNNVICRRTQLLEYFGELFPSSECKRNVNTGCDNCRQVSRTAPIDCTRMSMEIIKLVSELNQSNFTMSYAMDILRGVHSKTIRDAGHHHLHAYNSCRQLSPLDLERLISRLIIDDYLQQEFVDQPSNSIMVYLRPGVNAAYLACSTPHRSGGTTKIQIELIIRTVKQTPIEELNEQCFDELKKELKLIFSTTIYTVIVPEAVIKEMVKVMPRTKEEMINSAIGITEECYKQHGFHRLLNITRRFANQRDQIKRKNETTLNTSSSSSKQTSDEEEEEIDFSANFTDNNDRFKNAKKRPTASVITATIKRKRGSGGVTSNSGF